MIDAHQHFWRLDRGDYGWLTPRLAPIHRDFGPDDLAPILVRHGIQRTIVVQAAPTAAETRYLLDVAHATPFVAGVIGWIDFDAADAPEQVARVAHNPLVVGLRPMVHDLADDDWLLKPSHAAVFEAMIAHGLVFDALVRPKHLPRLARVIAGHPGLPVVLDHGAKPHIAGRDYAAWRWNMAEIAAHERVTCKLSGLLTEAAPGDGIDELRPVIETLLDTFGPRRLLWGSDWPVVNLAGGYDRWREITLAALVGLDDDARAAILGANAERVYLSR